MKAEIEKIVNWIRYYVENAKAKGVVIGLSGGVDSSVVAALAVRALGPEKVIALSLPCDSSHEDQIDAARVAKLLGIQRFFVRDLFMAYESMMSVGHYSMMDRENFVAPNTKARLRMVALYQEANFNNFLVIGTTNKSEYMTGYFTKWGDGAVDFEPLQNYLKTEVIKMARDLGLPEDICVRTPTPGLQNGVTDESELGMSYKELDAAIMAFDSYDWLSWAMTCYPALAKRLVELISISEHKRHVVPAYKRKSDGDCNAEIEKLKADISALREENERLLKG